VGETIPAEQDALRPARWRIPLKSADRGHPGTRAHRIRCASSCTMRPIP